MKISKVPFLYKQWLNEPSELGHEEASMHPAVKIYLWFCYTLVAQMLEAPLLLLLTAMTILIAMGVEAGRFLTLLRRTRWILFSIFFIYAFSSPGEQLWPQLGMFSPVVDGIKDGLLQLSRLIIVLAGLSILLALLSQSQLMSGLYALFRPVAFVGLSRERLSVRLALTLRYAESAMHGISGNWRASIEQQLAHEHVAPENIEIQVASFSRLDWLWSVVASAILLGVWL